MYFFLYEPQLNYSTFFILLIVFETNFAYKFYPQTHIHSRSKHAEKLVQIRCNYFVVKPFKKMANEKQYPTDKNTEQNY